MLVSIYEKKLNVYKLLSIFLISKFLVILQRELYFFYNLYKVFLCWSYSSFLRPQKSSSKNNIAQVFN
jgi:hypothetical protein